MEAHRRVAADCEQTWRSASWQNGHANPLLLAELRTRADAYLAIAEMDFEGVCETLGEEPSDD